MAYIDPFIRTIILSANASALSSALFPMYFLNSKELKVMKKKESTIWQVRGLTPVKHSCKPKSVVKDDPSDGD